MRDMARYFFDLHDGVEIIDEVGLDLATLDHARHHAVMKMAELLMQSPGQFWAGDVWTLTVKDDLGLVLFALNFSATKAAVVADASARSAG
jgi:hypothetical protein